MAAWRHLKPGTTVVLLDPLSEFEGIRPSPVPVGTRGVVRGNIEPGLHRVAWDTGYTSEVHQREIRVERGRK